MPVVLLEEDYRVVETCYDYEVQQYNYTERHWDYVGSFKSMDKAERFIISMINGEREKWKQES